MGDSADTVLILGAGINGAAIARELALNGVGVVVVERADIAFGTTAYSSRLIHGGLRYLEYGEFALVRESVEERTRWLRLAPHLVRPLEMNVPVDNRFGGLWTAMRTFLGYPPKKVYRRGTRGLWPVRWGLRLYDLYARDPSLPRHRVVAAGNSPLAVNRFRYRWLAQFHDAQLRFPERFTVELLSDGRQIAADRGSRFDVLTYHVARRSGDHVEIVSVDGNSLSTRFKPTAIVNATGAWVDETLSTLGVASKPLIGGTKGSHFLTSNEALRQALGGAAIYAEAHDGRPIFILPFGEQTLVGTTDDPYQGDPADAVATPQELDYLLTAVNAIVPSAKLTQSDIEMHYCGVRPLPSVDAASTAAITRRHWLHRHDGLSLPMFSVIGGKLTTCRSLAEESVAMVLAAMGRKPTATSRDRPLPGVGSDPENPAAETSTGLEALFGAQHHAVMRDCGSSTDGRALSGTDLPEAAVRWAVRREWARTLEDLVERRLMLLYHPRLTRACLVRLAEILHEEGLLAADDVLPAVERAIHRLQTHFGKQVPP